ncbi:hypothetical protein [Enterococcus faecalis]|uniref:hypothetical protein n=1 Tax=Enterococcus faecalis TaxID=1351 RepID=UPI0032DEEA0E
MKIIDSLSLDALIAVSAAMLTLLIPVAIFLIEGTGRSDENEDSFYWDKMVIFSQVIKPKLTYFSLLLITVPLIFWNSSNTPCKFIILILIVFGNVIMFSILKSSYSWLISKNLKKGSFREHKRLEFLTKLSKNTEMSSESKVETWETIWQANKIDMNSSKLIEVFISYYSDVEYDSKYKLLHVFSENLKIDFENKDKVQEFVYSQINQYNDAEAGMKAVIEDLILNYLRISVQKKYLREAYFDVFNKFFDDVNEDNIKYKLLNFFQKSLILDFENKDKVQEFVYSQINQYNEAEGEMKNAIKNLFLNYMRISVQEDYLRYSFFETLDKFFSEADDSIVESIFRDTGVELIEIIKELHLNRFDNDFPEFLKYDTVKSGIKKNSLCNMYFKWLDERYVLIQESNFKERMFANELLMFMFENVSPISFFRLTEFSSWLYKNYYSEENLKSSILEFARKPVKFIGIGRVYSIISSEGEANDENKFEERFKQETEWTYRFISNSTQKIYNPLKDKNTVQRITNLINKLLSDNPNILNEKEKSKLQGVNVELKHYEEQIFG